MDELENSLGSAEVTQAVLTQLNESASNRQPVANESLGRGRQQNLPSVPGAHQPGCPIEDWAEVVVPSLLGDTGVKAHSHLQGPDWAPGLFGQRDLSAQRRLHRSLSGWKGSMNSVPGGLDDPSAHRFDRLVQDRIVTRQGRLHCLRMRLPQTR
jgi:hypothetical protein